MIPPQPAPGDDSIGAPCYANPNNEFVFRVNFFAAAFGQYEVEGCPGTSPTLMLTRGVEYTFVQEHVSNWYGGCV